MPDQIQAFRILGGDDREAGVLLNAVDGIDEMRRAVHGDAPAKGSAGKARTDGLRDFGGGDRAGVLALRAIRQRNDDHLGVRVTKSAA